MNSGRIPAGDGTFRGGPGGLLAFTVETEEPALANTAGDGARHGACGILGGSDGAPHHYVLHSAGRAPRVIRTKETGIEVRPGDRFEIASGGGGGWGDPAARSAAARADDVESGFVSASGS